MLDAIPQGRVEAIEGPGMNNMGQYCITDIAVCVTLFAWEYGYSSKETMHIAKQVLSQCVGRSMEKRTIS